MQKLAAAGRHENIDHPVAMPSMIHQLVLPDLLTFTCWYRTNAAYAQRYISAVCAAHWKQQTDVEVIWQSHKCLHCPLRAPCLHSITRTSFAFLTTRSDDRGDAAAGA
jgi:hypothetical protein